MEQLPPPIDAQTIYLSAKKALKEAENTLAQMRADNVPYKHIINQCVKIGEFRAIYNRSAPPKKL